MRISLTFLALFFSVGLANQSVAQTISHWSMDGSGIADIDAIIPDIVGDNDGFVINEAVEYVAGPADSPSALLFEGSTQDKIDVPDAPSLQFDLETQSFTMETVFRVTEGVGGRPAPFSKNGSSADDSQYWARVRADQAGAIQFLVRGDGGDGPGGVIPPERIATTSGTVTDGLWHHFAAVYSVDTPAIQLYLDYSLDTTIPLDASDGIIGDNVDGLILGGFTSSSREFDGAIADIRFSNVALTPDQFLPELAAGLRQTQVAGDGIGVAVLDADVSNFVVGEPRLRDGLAQYWYDGNMRGNVEAFQAAGDEGSDANPLITPPFASDTTWWAGSQNRSVISELPLPAYPDGLRGTRFDGSNNSDNYGVRLRGEIFFEADGEYLLRDGIDDFTMIAIDQDGNGELDELDTLTNDDVGNAGFGDVLVLDDDWARIDGSRQQAGFHGFADIENIAGDGEWRQIEIWMSEGGGGDSGIVYMGSLDDDNIFDDTNGEALSQEERDAFVIRNDRLRSTVASVESADANAALRDDVEYVVQVSADGNDQFAIDNQDGLYNTTLDVTGATIRIEVDGELAEGTALQLFDADNILGVDTLTLLFDDESQWDTSQLAQGTLNFGEAPLSCNVNTGGDLNGSGTVDFADFLILSASFGQQVDDGPLSGDVDCNGRVEFPDFLTLSANFGQAVGAATQGVPEPSAFALFGLAVVSVLAVRKRSC